MNWYIGQEVACVKTHSRGLVKEGVIYGVKSLRESVCKCKDIDINVGIKSNAQIFSCNDCGVEVYDHDGIQWFSETLFAPLMDISELKEILNEEIQRI